MDDDEGGVFEGIRNEKAGNKFPVMLRESDLSVLVDMVALSVRNVCDGNRLKNKVFQEAVANLAQVILKQAFAYGGPDAVWVDPNDGSYHHPTFPEQGGVAYHAWSEHRNECVEMEVVWMASRILAQRAKTNSVVMEDAQQHYEHQLLDLLEQEGVEGLLKTLIDWPTNAHPYS